MSPERFVKGESERTLFSCTYDTWCLLWCLLEADPPRMSLWSSAIPVVCGSHLDLDFNRA